MTGLDQEGRDNMFRMKSSSAVVLLALISASAGLSARANSTPPRSRLDYVVHVGESIPKPACLTPQSAAYSLVPKTFAGRRLETLTLIAQDEGDHWVIHAWPVFNLQEWTAWSTSIKRPGVSTRMTVYCGKPAVD